MSNKCLVGKGLTSTKDTHSSHTVEELLTYKRLIILLLKTSSISIQIKEHFDQTASHSTEVTHKS